MNITRIVIADLRIEIQTENTLEITDNFKNFITEAFGHSDCRASFRHVDLLGERKGEKIGGSHDMDVVKAPNGSFYRYYRSLNKEAYFAIGEPVVNGSESVVRYSDAITPGKLNQCFYMTGWESMMISHGRMILHSSCIKTRYGGILFSGASGIGKSTQADLWIKYRQAELVNGDRTILYHKVVWRGYGSPFAGSSQCYRNESVPVRAIVMLAQGPDNRIRRLSVLEAFKAVYAGITIYTWEQEFVEKALDLVNALVTDIPVYLLSCTPDEAAVCELENVLKL